MLVPKIGSTDKIDLERVRWILVIEKEVSADAALPTNAYSV